MKIKRYVARNITEALRLIKSDLGPDAVIISSRKVRPQGVLGFLMPRRLEVMAAIDEPQPVQERTAAVAGGRMAVPAPSPPPPPAPSPSFSPRMERSDTGGVMVEKRDQVDHLHRELNEIKHMIKRFSQPDVPAKMDQEAEDEEGFYVGWQRLLQDTEVRPDIIEGLMTKLRQQVQPDAIQRNELARICLQNEIIRLIEPIYADLQQNRILAFIGPTGVGKTTTLAKMAAQFTLFNGKNCAIITIDTYRIGAVEQLRIYADIMGVPLEIAMTPHEFQEAVARHQNKDFIFVDTAGRPAHNVEKVVELESYFEVLDEPCDIILAVSSNTKYRDLIRTARDFGTTRYSRLIFTKVDETDTLGCILNIIYQTKLPVVYITDGQNVPDDIQSLYPKKLAKLLTRGVEPNA